MASIISKTRGFCWLFKSIEGTFLPWSADLRKHLLFSYPLPEGESPIPPDVPLLPKHHLVLHEELNGSNKLLYSAADEWVNLICVSSKWLWSIVAGGKKYIGCWQVAKCRLRPQSNGAISRSSSDASFDHTVSRALILILPFPIPVIVNWYSDPSSSQSQVVSLQNYSKTTV